MTARPVAVLVFVVALAAMRPLASGQRGQSLVFEQDLRPHGYPDFKKDRYVSDYTEVQFLSDDLLLVSVNVRVFDTPVKPLLSDERASAPNLLLFSLGKQKLVTSAEYPVDEFTNSVGATQNGQFVVLNHEGVHVCNADLTCGALFATKGPIRVLPGGTRLLVGGNGQMEVDLLDASTLQVLKHPAPRNLSMGLVEGVFLAPRRARGPLAASKGQGEIINETTVASSDSADGRTIAIRRVDGDALYQIPVTAAYETTLAPNRSGSRFCTFEQSYTRWNSIVNFLDIDGGRPHNFARVRVFDTDSGKQLFEMNWDPRPSQTVPPPALSPDGHKLALIRHAELEVFDLP